MSINQRRKISPFKIALALIAFYAVTAGFVMYVIKSNEQKSAARKPASVEHEHMAKANASFEVELYADEENIQKGDEFHLNVVIHPSVNSFNAVFECALPENVKLVDGSATQYMQLKMEEEKTVTLLMKQLDNENAQIHCGISMYDGATKLGTSGQFNTLMQAHIDEVLEARRTKHAFLKSQGFEQKIQQ